MNIQENISLKSHSTMRLGGNAAYLCEIADRSEIPQLVAWAKERQLPLMTIGDGSNIVWGDAGFPGLVIVNKIPGLETYAMDEQTMFASAAGGENWDNFVKQTVEAGFYGLELLSFIPGTAGGAPIQNIGAYGAQLSDVLSTIEAYDTQIDQFVALRSSECDFGYRTSRFKTTDKNRFIITKITVRLTKTLLSEKETYHSLESYLTEHAITDRSPATIRDAVIAVRTEKLPDPAIVANCGSFFANPIITKDHLQNILDTYPDLRNWHSRFVWDLPDGNVKVAAGALLEHEGFKGLHDPETGMATWDKQGLVLVNEHAQSTADLLKFKKKIVDTIQSRFGIVLEQEPELI